MASMLNLILVGLNHRTAGIAARERAAFTEQSARNACAVLAQCAGIAEAMVLSTCNRVEVLAAVEDIAPGQSTVARFISESSGVGAQELRPVLYRHAGDDAVRHIVRVTASLDSMILGEPQILGQVKSAYGIAREAGTAGAVLNTVVQGAFRTAKRIRSDTDIGHLSVSVSSAAVELAGKVLGSLHDRSVLIVGTGKMGESAVRHLVASGAHTIRVTNRSPEAARKLAQRFNGTAVPFEQLVRWLARSDVAIVSTAAPHMLVDRAMALTVVAERKHVPIVFIDISVPRNVDPAVASIDNVFCYDIDDLGAVVEANLQERRKEAAAAERIVEHEVGAICARLRSLDVTPVMVQVQQRIGQICRDELDRYLRKNGPREPGEIKELESMMARIAGKISHPMMTQLRSLHREEDPETHVAAIKRMFKLESGERDSD